LSAAPHVPEFHVAPLATIPLRRRPKNWRDHVWHAAHEDDPSLVVTAASEEQLRAACEGLRLLPSWRLSLEQSDKSPDTIQSYFEAVRTMSTYLADNELPTDVEDIEPEHLRRFLRDWKEQTSAGRAATIYRSLRVYFGWCVKEDERPAPSPMDRVDKVHVSKKEHPVFDDDELRALIRACSGNDFESRRDLAIIRILMDNGVRVSGLAQLRYVPGDERRNDVFVSKHVLRVTLKGGNQFMAPIGRKAAAALDRYIRARKKHKSAESEWLWLPIKARENSLGEIRLDRSGIQAMIERRAEQAGLLHANPHKFRRTMASNWDGDSLHLMRVGGWESIEMVRLYGRKGEERKAREAHAIFSPGDRI
jgi:site-specific recombinase XerD